MNNTTENKNSSLYGILVAIIILASLLTVMTTKRAEAQPCGGVATYEVKVDSGYLALRTAKAYDYTNEIGELYTGDTVSVYNYDDSTYWYVYSSKYGCYGYVNKNYLVSTCTVSYTSSCTGTWTVKVDSGYLALRTAKAYDDANEIGELYTGDTVTVVDRSDSTYWYVYSPKHSMYGYVNSNYLR